MEKENFEFKYEDEDVEISVKEVEQPQQQQPDVFTIGGLEEAIEITKEKEENIRPFVDELYAFVLKHVESTDEEFDLLDAFSTLSKTSTYFTQSYFATKEEFDEEYKIARQLVTENIIQSLGVNANDVEKNLNSIVTYNGEPDLDNFSLKRILLIANQLTEYALWQLTLTKTFEKKANELN